MSGFFSLGGGGGGGGKDHHQNQDHPELGVGGNNNNNNNLYLFKNEEIYSKGFELWQQYYHMHHHHRAHHNHLVDFSVGVGPSNAAAVSGGAGGAGSSSSSGNLVGDDEQNQGPSFRVLRPGGAATAGGGGGVNCQDCGNQAKKDCSHLRCRTCCKSRGFQCQTHVKSTWVSAAKRRERQQQLFSLHHHQQQQQHELSLRGGGENPKRQRDSSSPLACTRIPTTSTGLEVAGHFPGEVNSPAVFRCVKVSAMDDDVDQYAYQTAVSIGGHVFKGILYDQGPETRYNTGHESSSAAPQQPLNLIAGAGAGSHQQAAATTMIDPSMYPTPFSAFMAGTQFFPPPRP